MQDRDRMWKTADGRIIPFDNIERTHLKNIIRKFNEASKNPKDHKGFLIHNPLIVVENIILYAEKLGIKLDEKNNNL